MRIPPQGKQLSRLAKTARFRPNHDVCPRPNNHICAFVLTGRQATHAPAITITRSHRILVSLALDLCSMQPFGRNIDRNGSHFWPSLCNPGIYVVNARPFVFPQRKELTSRPQSEAAKIRSDVPCEASKGRKIGRADVVAEHELRQAHKQLDVQSSVEVQRLSLE